MTDLIHKSNVCAIRDRSRGEWCWWECSAEHGAGWSKRIRQSWTLREARIEARLLFERGWCRAEDVEIVELAPKDASDAGV